jgi:hypothetical protein
MVVVAAMGVVDFKSWTNKGCETGFPNRFRKDNGCCEKEKKNDFHWLNSKWKVPDLEKTDLRRFGVVDSWCRMRDLEFWMIIRNPYREN